MEENKKKGKEKRKEKKGRWYYTIGGKVFRGFLCMVTFAAFMSGLGFTLVAESYLGADAFQVNPKDYHDTIYYSDDVAMAYSALLEKISLLESGSTNYELRIMDTTCNEIRDYDLQNLKDSYTEGELPGNLAGISKYKVNTEALKSQLYNYSWALQTLESESEKGGYLYFSKQSFKELFMYYGKLNTNQQYSPDFPENAYFIFDTKDIEGDVTDGDVGYAVYDPVADLYYSTTDDYFEPYDSYLYDCKEVLEKLDEYTNNKRGQLDNIALPLLWSENRSIYDVLSTKLRSINEEQRAAEALEAMKKDAFVYYVASKDFTYTNADSIEEITGLPYSYCVEKGLKNDRAEKAQKTVESLVGYAESGYFESSLEEYFADTPLVVCFGMDFDRAAANVNELDLSISQSPYMRYQVYGKVTSYGIFMLVFAVIACILLMVQAVSLILTTGRTDKKNKELETNMEIKLYAYDNLPTDIWLAVAMLVLGISVMVAVAGIDSMYYSDTAMLECILLGVACVMPFGFFFMILTLSFARRVKAKNLRNHLWLAGVFCWFRARLAAVYKKCAYFYYKKNGADRLWTLFLVYIFILLVSMLLVLLSIFLGMPARMVVFAGCIILIVMHIGAAVIICRICKDMKQITGCVDAITHGELDSKCGLSAKNSFFKELADGVNHIGDGLKAAVETSLKDERMKTELITNVSHDLKTPLTSIINYVDLLKKEDMQSEDARHYLEVLDAKSQRLKQLTEDLVEAAKANSGNIELECMPLAFDELMRQAIGEFEDKFATRGLTVVAAYPEDPAVIMADGRRLFRILENVLQNANKYALAGTRIYADLSYNMGVVIFTLKNISAAQLNISPEELMERFTRGDSSRTTEGSGLGLSIAKDLTRLMKGTFEIQLDGDLFKVIVRFPEHNKEG